MRRRAESLTVLLRARQEGIEAMRVTYVSYFSARRDKRHIRLFNFSETETFGIFKDWLDFAGGLIRSLTLS